MPRARVDIFHELDLCVIVKHLPLIVTDLCVIPVENGRELKHLVVKCVLNGIALEMTTLKVGLQLDLFTIALFRGRTPAWGQATTAWVNFPLGFAQ